MPRDAIANRSIRRRAHRGRRSVAALLIAIAIGAVPAVAAEAEAPADERTARGVALFRDEVRLVLAHNCLMCHEGEDAESHFDITTREGLLKGGELGVAVVPGNAGASRLVKLISHDLDPKMPEEADKLSDAEIAAVARWIDLGAPYDRPLAEDGPTTPWTERVVGDDARQFWSFQPLADVAPPDVKNTAWARTPIDRFILARLEEAGVAPNGPADRRTLIRRAWLDLLGLPPSPEAVDAFVNEPAPDAYERLIDRLLASPRYGERWARHWLDVARFAESEGFEHDYDRKHAYHYRDFVIKALNSDLPYDQFMRWQLAGDELAPDDPLALAATGFLGAGVFPTQLTEVEFEPARYDQLDDMTATTGSAFLGLTIGCARCHDHKFDPFPQRDYYRMAASFTTTIASEIDLELDSENHARTKQQFDAAHARLVEARAHYERDLLPKRLAEWLAARREGGEKARKESGPWVGIEQVSADSRDGSELVLQPDGSLLAGGKNPARDHYTLVVRTDLARVAALRIEALTDKSLPRGGPGRAGNGNFGLSDLKVSARPIGGGDAVAAKLARPRATHQQNTGNLAVAAAIDGDAVSGWAVDAGGIGKPQAAAFDLEGAIGFPDGTELVLELDFQTNTSHGLGRLRISLSDRACAPAEVGGSLPELVAAALATLEKDPALDKLAAPQRDALLKWFAPRDAEWSKLHEAVAAHAKKAPQPQKVKAQICSEGVKPRKHHADGRGFPHFYKETHFLKRGDAGKKEGVAGQAYIQVLMRGGRDETHWRVAPPTGAGTSFRRASLAAWLSDVEYGAGHLAARVIVNRLWHHHFGRGIVATPNDFGKQGAEPSHPELLDWLAADLVGNGWRLKRLHKQIMMSSVYVESSEVTAAAADADPDNRLFWRWRPRRLEAEAIRDALLQVAGLLDDKMYGPGTLDESTTRRSVYFTIKRSRLIPSMMLFDWPEHLVSIGSRGSTTIAPQALMFLNSPQVRRYAEALAGRVAKEADPLAAAYRLAVGRTPSDRERTATENFITSQTAAYTAAGKPNGKHLALVDACQSLLSLNEFLYVE